MSVDYTVHVGPFVECVNGRITKEMTRLGCTNTACKNYSQKYWDASKKFCDKCGIPIGEIKYQDEVRRVNADPMLVDEWLYPSCTHPENDDIDLWFGNKHRPNKDNVREFSFSPKYDGNKYIEITLDLMSAEITEFIDQYRDAISKLRAAYGLENVTIKWGVISNTH
jgi:hypothetical protein